ncbi:L-aspartate oxidase [Dethiosulfatibacter aminovorans DSM 17477]|uniref:L-aspartate oxidase n=1 Tax=Dethiosulfatibacter aminovorans DSM 17477 TaxID=1121476 RepID=A0A1M6E7I3_9FIRM|nr:L-aspartate oxidase [Dethiosulfatibacter aminovorans]SHI81363.1 L-aspartate oxidase [Dethiosulfatibacter aminovorans DSM 17477]
MKILNTDVLIIGTGVAGLYCALNLDRNLNVVMLSKQSPEECNTNLAQGGIAVRYDENDYEDFFNDTMKAGMYLNNEDSVKILVDESRDSILDLDRLGVPFNKNDGEFEYTREGAHARNRIVHCNDKSGKMVFETLYDHVRKLENVQILENTAMFDIEEKDGKCLGAYCLSEKRNPVFDKTHETIYIGSKMTVLATGGIGGIFKNSTNQSCLTGDGMAIAENHGVELATPDYIQFHPTALYLEERADKRRFLISESLRGEGALLYNCNGERFVDELLPRNTVTKAILEELEKTDSQCVYLDISHLDGSFLKGRFPKIYTECLKYGIDITSDRIPVTPSQHYHMGGIGVDLNSRTSMGCLYATGECACTGVHGGNRLASNSLLEGLVFSKRAADDINRCLETKKYKKIIEGFHDEIAMSMEELPGKVNWNIHALDLNRRRFLEPRFCFSTDEGKALVKGNRKKAMEIIGNLRKDLINELVDSR